MIATSPVATLRGKEWHLAELQKHLGVFLEPSATFHLPTHQAGGCRMLHSDEFLKGSDSSNAPLFSAHTSALFGMVENLLGFMLSLRGSGSGYLLYLHPTLSPKELI